MVGSLILFVLFIIIYVLISDVITVLFRLTGLTEENARFQVISLLTNSGFTTQQSEAVVSSGIRRRLARYTMLFGYAFTVTIVATMVNFFTTLSHSEVSSLLVLVPVLLALLVAFHLTRRSARFKAWFDGWIETIGNRLMFGKASNQILLVDDYGGMVVARIYLHAVPESLRELPLSDTDLMSRHHVMVMMVKSPEGEAKQANGNTVLRPNDTIMVLGKRKTIREIFERVEPTPHR